MTAFDGFWKLFRLYAAIFFRYLKLKGGQPVAVR